MRNIEKWIQNVAGTSPRQVALATDIPVPTLARQIRDNTVTPETVVRIARQYETSPLGGFVAIGLIDDAEANSMSVAEALSRATDLELAAEAVRRIEAGIAGGEITGAADDVAAELPTLAQKRAEKTYPKQARRVARKGEDKAD